MLPRRPVSSSRGPSPRRSRAPSGSDSWPQPWVQLKYFTFHPNVFPNMIGASSDGADDLVTVIDKEGNIFGHGFYNPFARVPLRIFQHGEAPLAEDHFDKLIEDAVSLRVKTLRLRETTDSFRVVHSDGDGIPGLVVDRFAETLAVEVTTPAVWARLEGWLPQLHEKLGTKNAVVHFDERAAKAENMSRREIEERAARLSTGEGAVKISENGVRFQVNFEHGHKTGFFSDQRDNRAQFARWVKGARVLDVCCYTGGFSVSAKVAGAEEVTGVDLDENAIATAKKNANLNQQRVSFVHADAFTWMRQAERNGESWDAVVLDPPKLIMSRDTFEEGRAKYHDMNKLALSLVARGGLFVTCSCSGLMPVELFEEIIIGLAHRSGRRLQILDRTGAGADHPVMSNCPESRYLKALWARVW